jgi:uncharacterized protein YjbJ (UPF0337 family)
LRSSSFESRNFAALFRTPNDPIFAGFGRQLPARSSLQAIQTVSNIAQIGTASLLLYAFTGEKMMDKDWINGWAKQIKDDAKQGFWKIFGDSMLEEERRADRIEGKVQNAAGSLTDTIKKASKKGT